MKKPSIGIVVPFFNTPMWIQTSIWGLVSTISKYKDVYDIEILVIDNVADEGYRGLKKTFIDALRSSPELSSNISIIKNPENTRFHGTALDTAVRYFNTDFLLCWESDIAIFNDNYLEWLLSFMTDPMTWMAGYEFTDYNDSKDTIVWYVMPNPGIYRLSILKEIDNFVQSNTDFTYYWGENYTQSKVMPPIYKPGVFSERRGFREVHPNCPDGKGKLVRPTPEYYENGQWLFYKMMRDFPQYNYKILDQKRQLDDYNGELTPSFSDFGDGRFRHYWAGTRSWDFLIHPEQNRSQINYVKEKIETEIKIWKSIVPYSIRKIIPDVFNACRNDDFEISNLNFLNNNISTIATQWYKTKFLDTNFQELLKD